MFQNWPNNHLLTYRKVLVWIGLMLNNVNNFSVVLGWSHRFLGITSTFWGIHMSCSRTQHSDPSGARTWNPPTSGSGVQGVNHQATAPPYRKVPKFLHTRKLCCNRPKIQTNRPNFRVLHKNNANGIATSEDPD